jgi:hypothetical protein
MSSIKFKELARLASGALMLLVLIVAVLNTAYIAFDLFKYRLSGERICAQLNKIAIEFRYDWSGRGKNSPPFLKVEYSYIYNSQNFIGGNVWPSTFDSAESREIVFLTKVKNEIENQENCLQIIVDKRNPKDSVLFLPDASVMLWAALKYKFLYFVIFSALYASIPVKTNR